MYEPCMIKFNRLLNPIASRGARNKATRTSQVQCCCVTPQLNLTLFPPVHVVHVVHVVHEMICGMPSNTISKLTTGNTRQRHSFPSCIGSITIAIADEKNRFVAATSLCCECSSCSSCSECDSVKCCHRYSRGVINNIR